MAEFTSATTIGIFSLLICHLLLAHGYKLDRNPYRHSQILDPKGKYQLEWNVDFENKRVVFNVTVETRGWVGLGLSRNKGKMTGADIVIGGVNPSGKVYFSDRHAIGNQYPVVDESQDWVLHSASESKTHTCLLFSRAFDTCDKHDIPITDDVTSVIWAYGETDSSSEYHFGNRGNLNIYLLDPDYTPEFVQGPVDPPNSKVAGLNVWTIRTRLQIPAKKTTYWCNFHKINLPQKHHLVGVSTYVNPESRSNVHHLLLFRCTPPANVDPLSTYEPFLQHRGGECYNNFNQGGRQAPLPTQFCVDIIHGFAIGGKADFYPDHVGIPLGLSNPSEYYVLQVHYDNPSGRPDIFSEIQIDAYYTENLREHDGAVLSMGHHIPGSPSLLLPPSSLDHRFYAHCSSACTRSMLPANGIKLVSALLHSHNAGRQLRIQHFRNNRELPWVSNDDNYIFSYQPSRFLRKEVTVLPGDQLTMRCVYDTTNKSTTTVGGYGTDQEMCKTFMLYYNKLPSYPICRSEIISPEYMERYLGITNVTWDESRLEFVTTSPSHLAGHTISEVSDSMDWNLNMRAQLQRDHITYPHVSICPNAREVSSGQLQPSLVTYPIEAEPYDVTSQCSLKG